MLPLFTLTLPLHEFSVIPIRYSYVVGSSTQQKILLTFAFECFNCPNNVSREGLKGKCPKHSATLEKKELPDPIESSIQINI